MKFEGNLAVNLPSYDDLEQQSVKEKLSLENLALEKLEKGEKITAQEKQESFKILFEQDPDLAMELAKKEEHFPITALTKSNLFYFQPSVSKAIIVEVISALNQGKIKTDEFKLYADEFLNLAKKNKAFDILKNAGGVGRKTQKDMSLNNLISLTGRKDEELETLLSRVPNNNNQGKKEQEEREEREEREEQVLGAEKIYLRETDKIENLPEGKSIIYQNAKAVFSEKGEKGLVNFLKDHQERIKELPPHLLIDLHYMRYADYRKLKLKEQEKEIITPIKLGIEAVNLVKDKLENGEPKIKATTKSIRQKKLAKILEQVLNANGQTITENFAFNSLKQDFEKKIKERYGASVSWKQEEGIIIPDILLKDKEAGDDKIKNLKILEYFNQAKQTANIIEDENYKAEALREIAKAEVACENFNQAKQTFDQAKQTANIIEDENYKAEALREIAKAEAISGNFDQAKQTANLIKKENYKAEALKEIAKAEAISGNFDQAKQTFNQAKQTTNTIKDEYCKAGALKEIAKAEAISGNFDQAKQTIDIIKDKNYKAEALEEIAKAEAVSGNFDQAKQTVNIIEDENYKADALKEIAKAEAISGNFDQAKETFNQAKQTIDIIKDKNHKASALKEIAKAEAISGNFDQAKETVDIIEYEYYKIEALREIAKAEAISGNFDQAKETFDQAKQAADTIEDKNYKASVLREIAKAEAISGNFDQAKETANLIKKENHKVSALKEIAKAEAISGNFDQAKQIADLIEDEYHKAEILEEIAKAEAISGNFNQAKQTVNIIEDEYYKVGALEEIAKAEAISGNFDQAKQTADIIECENHKASALKEIAKAEVISGNFDQAKQTFDQAKQTADIIEYENYKAGALEEIAKAEAISGLDLFNKSNIKNKEKEKIKFNHTEKKILQLINILNTAKQRPYWKEDMTKEDKEGYGKFYDEFMDMAKEFIIEDSKVISPDIFLEKILADYPEKNKLYAQKNSFNTKEFINDFKDIWLKQFIKPEQKKSFSNEINNFRKSFKGKDDFNTVSDFETSFMDQTESKLIGGDPKEVGKEIMDVGNYRGFLVKQHLSGNNAPFSKNNLDFIEQARFRETEDFEFLVKPVPKKINKLNIPMPPNSRIKKIVGVIDGKEIEIENQGVGNIIIRLEKKYDEIKYIVEKNKLKNPIHKEAKTKNLNEMYKKLPDSITKDFSKNMFSLPPEIKAEIEKIKDLPVKEKVAHLQKTVQDNFYYDQGYGEWRKDAGIDIKRRMHKAQLMAKKHKKLFAGVCAEANIVMSNVLRQAGIYSGIAEGFFAKNKEIKNTDAHAVAYAILPNSEGKLDKYYVDGTPGGSEVGCMPNISELEEEWIKELEKAQINLEEKESQNLEKMIKYLNNEAELLNEDIEALLNGHLKKITIKGQESYINIHQMLNFIRFSGLKINDFEKIDEKTKKYISKQIKNKLSRDFIEKEIEKNNKEIGESIMDELQKTINNLQEKNNLDKNETCKWFKKINQEQLVGVLSVEERALLNLAIEYAKKN